MLICLPSLRVAVKGDIAVDNKIVFKNQTIIMVRYS